MSQRALPGSGQQTAPISQTHMCTFPETAHIWRLREVEGLGPGHLPDGTLWSPRNRVPSGTGLAAALPGTHHSELSFRVSSPCLSQLLVPHKRLAPKLHVSICFLRTQRGRGLCAFLAPRKGSKTAIAASLGDSRRSGLNLRKLIPNQSYCTIPSLKKHHIPRKGPGLRGPMGGKKEQRNEESG